MSRIRAFLIDTQPGSWDVPEILVHLSLKVPIKLALTAKE